MGWLQHFLSGRQHDAQAEQEHLLESLRQRLEAAFDEAVTVETSDPGYVRFGRLQGGSLHESYLQLQIALDVARGRKPIEPLIQMLMGSGVRGKGRVSIQVTRGTPRVIRIDSPDPSVLQPITDSDWRSAGPGEALLVFRVPFEQANSTVDALAKLGYESPIKVGKTVIAGKASATEEAAELLYRVRTADLGEVDSVLRQLDVIAYCPVARGSAPMTSRLRIGRSGLTMIARELTEDEWTKLGNVYYQFPNPDKAVIIVPDGVARMLILPLDSRDQVPRLVSEVEAIAKDVHPEPAPSVVKLADAVIIRLHADGQTSERPIVLATLVVFVKHLPEFMRRLAAGGLVGRRKEDRAIIEDLTPLPSTEASVRFYLGDRREGVVGFIIWPEPVPSRDDPRFQQVLQQARQALGKTWGNTGDRA